MLTIQEATEVGIRHALGGRSPNDALQERSLLNLAGKHLVGMHRWEWLRRTLTPVDVVGGQPWVELPCDAVSVDEVSAAQYGVCFELVSLSLIQSMRANSFEPAAGVYAYVAPEMRDVQQDAEDGRRRQLALAIYRTPQSSMPQGLLVNYRAGWFTLSGALNENEQLPLPQDGSCDALYIAVLRAFARGWELEDRTNIANELLLCEPLLATARAQDVRRAEFRGVIRNGLVGSASAYQAMLRNRQPDTFIQGNNSAP